MSTALGGRASAQPAATTAGAAVSFEVTASPAARAAFERGVGWLHSFEYEEALESFKDAQRIEPQFALAYWGEALCYHQTLWLNEDVEAARRALSAFAPAPDARARKTPTPRERAYIEAVDVLFAPGDRQERKRAYAEAMRRLSSAWPDDAEAAAFYGLALLGTASRGRSGGHHDDDVPLLAGSDVQEQAAGIFTAVLARHPRHPGALHYLLHTWDDPANAPRALDAARRYPSVAPESSHARHMPAHIFLQLGRFADASASDEASFAASEAWVARRGLPQSRRDFHSLSWLAYEYLQQGRIKAAAERVAVMERAAREANDPRLMSLHATMLARHVIETEAWQELRPDASRNDHELFAIGLSAARRGEVALAGKVLAYLDEMCVDPRYRNRWSMLEIFRREIRGWTAHATGQSDAAITALREAADREGQLPPPLGPASPVKPASELFGELLLEIGRPAEARPQFDATLKRAPNRARSLLGAARAAARSGDAAAARSHYATFLEQWRAADPGLAAIDEARAALAGAGAWSWPGALAIPVALASAAAIWWTRRSRRRARAPAVNRTAEARKTRPKR